MNKIKKIAISLIVVAMTIIGLSEATTSAANSLTTSVTMNEDFAFGGTSYIHTSDDSYNVYATFEAAYMCEVYVKFELQRYTNGSWSTISTKKGGIATNSHDYKKNANVTFENISNSYGASTRVKVTLYADSGYTDSMQTANSKTWTR